MGGEKLTLELGRLVVVVVFVVVVVVVVLTPM